MNFKEPKSFKRSKASGSDWVDVNVIVNFNCVSIHKNAIAKDFNEWLTLGIFPEKTKITNVVPIFKSGRKKLLSNYESMWHIPILSYFSKILKRIMYNQQCKIV